MMMIPYHPMPYGFYCRKDVVQIARELLGKIIYTSFNQDSTSGVIVETEAYAGITDKASHAYNNRRTVRTETMYMDGGHAYVYLCYGIHSLFNIVTSVKDDPHAVLIRGIEPLHEIGIMKCRLGKNSIENKHGIGPGNVAKLLGIKVSHSGMNLYADLNPQKRIWIQDEGIMVPEAEIISSPRIGVSYAGEDALLPYRFRWIRKK